MLTMQLESCNIIHYIPYCHACTLRAFSCEHFVTASSRKSHYIWNIYMSCCQHETMSSVETLWRLSFQVEFRLCIGGRVMTILWKRFYYTSHSDRFYSPCASFAVPYPWMMICCKQRMCTMRYYRALGVYDKRPINQEVAHI